PQHVVELQNSSVDEIRVGCFNIAHGRGEQYGGSNWDGGDKNTKINRCKQIGRLLRAEQLDIVVLNEVDFSSAWSGHTDQARIIAEEAGYPYIVEQRNLDMAVPFFSIRFGNAMLSKFPISNTRFIDYPNLLELVEPFTGGFKEGVVSTIELPGGKNVQVAAVHLYAFDGTLQGPSGAMLLEHYKQSGIPLIAMGDFNTAPRGYPQYLTDKQGRNALEMFLHDGHFSTLPRTSSPSLQDFTFPATNPERVLDWIVVSDPYHIRSKKVVPSALSDHLPVTATINID
ncbi:MAG: endonuclease/exonuclease/phosphatase family protein, partial [Desulfobulbaceae bacterium]|nr:endonuclease/exonuclease/phosphatase family protein [Desulfobulbaceae bacterium]